MKSIQKAYQEEIDYISGRMNGTIRSMKTRWKRLNAAGIDGLEYGTINIIAAMSGVGKTTLANQLVFDAINLNKEDDIAVLFFTVEMSARRLISRYISSQLSIPVKDIYKSPPEIQDKIKKEIAPTITDFDIVYEEGMYSPAKIIQKIREFCKARIDKKCIIIYDHSLLIRRSAGQSERDALIDLSMQCNMAKKVFPNSIFFIVSQLNRDIETPERIAKKQLHYPKKSDIFGSDALFQIADVVLVLHDPAKLHIKRYGPEELPVKGLVYAHLLKVREGKPGNFVLKNHAHINKFPELTLTELTQYGFKR